MSIVKKRGYIYLDNAASTPIDPRVIWEMNRFTDHYGNPSSFNDFGRLARKIIEEARYKISHFLTAHPDELIFNSSGSEANNLAILGLAGAFKKPAEIIASPIEHPSVLEPLKKLEFAGWKITFLKVNKEGIIDLRDLEIKLNLKVALVSVMSANNEIGSIQPIGQVAKIIKKFRTDNNSRTLPVLHSDACQAAGYLDIKTNNLGVDLLTFNGSKIYGPRGIGLLYARRGVSISPLICGGDQERGLRAGTENLSAITGLAKAVEIIDVKEKFRLEGLRDYFFEKIVTKIPEIRINGPLGSDRLPGNINISIPGLDSENMLLELDGFGVYASAGSACTARSVEPSHVLKAIGVDKKYINGSLRFSLGRRTTKEEIDNVLKILPKAVVGLRKRYKLIHL